MKTLEASFDLVFIDADKGNYINYYEAALPLLSERGVIVADNVLWSGRVLEPKEPDDHAIVAFDGPRPAGPPGGLRLAAGAGRAHGGAPPACGA